MRIISFGWTSKALLAGNWKKCPIKPGDIVQAWDASPRFGGQRIAMLRILKVDRVIVREIDDADAKLE